MLGHASKRLSSASGPKTYPSDQWIGERTDKLSHGYIPSYMRIAADIGSDAAVCEIGVWHGGSLALWQELFPNGIVVGVDIDAGAIWPKGTIKLVQKQESPDLPLDLREVLRQHGRTAFNLIVDDASHLGGLSQKTFELTWPLVAPGGYWVLEDWFVGLPESAKLGFGPSMAQLAMSFVEKLTKHSDIEDIYYRYALAVLRKKKS